MQHDDRLGHDDAMWHARRHVVGLPDNGCAPPRPADTSYAPYISKDEFEDDLCLAVGLFDILARDDRGVIFSDRIKPGGREGPSFDEQKARDAAARLLLVMSLGSSGQACQRPLRQFCADLAALTRSGAADEPFELVLRRRPGRKAPSSQLNELIAGSLVWQVYDDGCVQAAVLDAARKYDVSERTVWAIWEVDAKHQLEVRKFIDAAATHADGALQEDAT